MTKTCNRAFSHTTTLCFIDTVKSGVLLGHQINVIHFNNVLAEVEHLKFSKTMKPEQI